MASTSNNLSLAVARGKTKFPQRPINADKFLIGSGQVCDLRLGGPTMPPLHSVIHSDDSETWIDALVQRPSLVVNGEETTSTKLSAGDQLQIGEFEFVVCDDETSVTAQEPIADNSLVDEDISDEELGHLISDMTAEQLVDQLERDLALLDQHEAEEQLGVQALLHTVVERQINTVGATGSQPQLAAPAGDAQLIQQIDRAIQALNQFSCDLRDRSEKMAERESSYAEAAVTMLDLQHQMAGQLETLIEQISVMKSKQEPVIRKVA
ncbi:MAG: hypothetical protein CMJ78_00400 [Planctomycetaceae bacterium]|nr:hypothetical protein [Planctomycetaceae bacterium]